MLLPVSSTTMSLRYVPRGLLPVSSPASREMTVGLSHQDWASLERLLWASLSSPREENHRPRESTPRGCPSATHRSCRRRRRASTTGSPSPSTRRGSSAAPRAWRAGRRPSTRRAAPSPCRECGGRRTCVRRRGPAVEDNGYFRVVKGANPYVTRHYEPASPRYPPKKTTVTFEW